MKLFAHEAGPLLLEKARSLAGRQTSWRCIHIDFSSYRSTNTHMPRRDMIAGILVEMFKNHDGQIYFCEDGDLVLLFEGKILTVKSYLEGYFTGMANDHDGASPQLNILDLSNEWARFVSICEEKANFKPIAPSSALPPGQAATTPTGFVLPEVDGRLFRAALSLQEKRRRNLVMIVEDDSFTRRLLGVTLKNDCDVVEAANAAEAIEMYSRHAPDAVFLDIELPDACGHAVLQKILSFNRAAFIVMLSAHSIRQNVLAALEQGAQGFITKPFAKDKLLHYLNMSRAAQLSTMPAVS